MFSIDERLKKSDSSFHSLIGVRKVNNSDEEYLVDYVAIIYWKTMKPEFRYNTITLNLKAELRDIKIQKLIKAQSKPRSEFDVESLIYTPEQLQRLKELRSDNVERGSFGWAEVRKAKSEYSLNFELGQKVYYNDQKGIITFKHEEKGIFQRWSVKVNDTEYRRVYGYELLARKVEDLSMIPIDKDLDKLSTVKLLKMYRRKMKVNNGIGDRRIKRILMDREHVQKQETKIVWVR